ncbi:MAG: tail fiber domain-containing protein [Acidobacteriaceae bacterium]|nr:tail fiber domain-containing protein [Acidobacteriaceae bacterium]
MLIDSNGQLGTISSSRRYKEEIQDMGAASDGLLHLRPVTFRYKTLCRRHEADPVRADSRGSGGDLSEPRSSRQGQPGGDGAVLQAGRDALERSTKAGQGACRRLRPDRPARSAGGRTKATRQNAARRASPIASSDPGHPGCAGRKQLSSPE